MDRNTENEENPNEILVLDIDLGLNAFKNAKKYIKKKTNVILKKNIILILI